MPLSELTASKLASMAKSALKASGAVEVVKHASKVHTAKGDNYCGEVCAVDMEVKVEGEANAKEMHWIVKTLPVTQIIPVPVIRAMKMEEKEAAMYTEIIPAWKKLITERKADIKVNFCDCYYSEITESSSLLALENMNKHGYRDAINKLKGLSAPHVKLTLAELAKYHALGHALVKGMGWKAANEKYPALMRDYTYAEPPKEASEFFSSWGKPGDTLLNTVGLIQDPGQDLVGLLKKYNEKHDLNNVMSRLCAVDPNGFNTICHADTWANNLLFKYPEGSTDPTECMLIDLALTCWNNPSIDVTILFYLSTMPSLRKTHEEEFLSFYHEELVRNLQKLGEDPGVYTYSQFVEDFDSRRMFGLAVAFQILPALMAVEDDGVLEKPEGEKENDEESAKKSTDFLANNPDVKMFLQGTVLEMIEKGALNV